MSAAESTSRRTFSPRLRQIVPWLSAAVLIAGIAIFVITVFASDDKKVAPVEPARNTAPAARQSPTKVPVAQGARLAAGKFILTAVARRNVGDSWSVTHPELRAGYTRAQWNTGDIPVVPFPIASAQETRFKVEESYKNEVLLTVALIPRPGADIEATTFWIGLKASGQGENRTWRVNYWMPRWNAAVPNAKD